MMLSPTDQARLARQVENLGKYAQTELGYPSAFDIDYKPLEAFLGYSQNNIGDPLATGRL